jgi:mycothiol synthase
VSEDQASTRPDTVTGSPRVDVSERLDGATVDAVLALIDAATKRDGVRPISEQALLRLRHGGDADERELVLYDADGAVAAYAHLDRSDEAEGASAELAAHPAYRGRGHERALLAATLDATHDGRLRLWAHGKGSETAKLARAMAFTPMRELWQLRRPLSEPLPDPAVPEGVTVRTFRPGEDDDAWVALNARAFASHPEQGRLTIEDLHERMAEPWFDPAGFFVAERDGHMVGFHWTKVHPAGAQADDPVGEVYVVGVDPDAHGGGLGKALTLAGLHHLRDTGLRSVLLYVDADNEAAVRLYTRLGFTHWDTDAMFRR